MQGIRLAIILATVLKVAVLPASTLATQGSDALNNYELGKDSKSQPDVPKGKTFQFQFDKSAVFPGTSRTVTVYVPDQYKGDKPACVYVGLDGLGFGVPLVFDNLIHKGEMPVTIAVGVSPGKVSSTSAKDNPRFNRSFEFDGLNDSLARCILMEVLPEVERHQTPDGLPIKLSDNPNDRCVGGGSTGGIAAFTLAWEHPDAFRRVFSAIGTFVCMRGGDRYPVLVRKTEPKPIRIFQQDGENDEWMGGPEVGDWWMGNQTLDRALEFAGYDHMHVWGTGTHNGKHAAAIFPDAMRYLWRDWPQPVVARTGMTQNVFLKAILDPSSNWQPVPGVGEACDQPVANQKGEVFYRGADNRHFKLGTDGRITEASGIPLEPFTFTSDGRAVSASGLRAACLVATSDGRIYATESESGRFWLIKADGSRTMLDEGLRQPTGIALSPDGLWLAVMERNTHWGYSYRVKSDGTVEFKQRFYWSHVPDWAEESGAGGMCMDRDGRAYVATHLGIQIFDRNGRSRCILPMPEGEPAGLCFGGAAFDTLFVTSGGKIYERKVKTVGAPPFASPMKLPPWGPG